MPNKILLVDDEKIFLQSLKKGLAELSDVFETDICFSVTEAIKQLEANEYDLVVTDIRMPFKSGIDLLLYLRSINFSGGIKLMSAYKTEENLKKINNIGIVDVISKPFDLEWFQSMLLEYFEKEQESSVTFESIDLLSVMQVINIDKKSSALKIEINGKNGFIYFKDGEIINAEYEDFQGEDAVLELMALNQGKISVIKIKGKVKRTIKTPFVEFIMNTMKRIDEQKEYKKKNENKMLKKNNNKEEKMARMSDVLTALSDEIGGGFQTASVFGADGIPIALENPANMDIDAFSAKLAIVSSLVTKTIKDLSGGTVSELLIEEEKGWTLVRPIAKTGMNLLISVTSEATLGNLRLVAKRLAADLEKPA